MQRSLVANPPTYLPTYLPPGAGDEERSRVEFPSPWRFYLQFLLFKWRSRVTRLVSFASHLFSWESVRVSQCCWLPVPARWICIERGVRHAKQQQYKLILNNSSTVQGASLLSRSPPPRYTETNNSVHKLGVRALSKCVSNDNCVARHPSMQF